MNKKGISSGTVKILGILQILGGAAMLAQQFDLYPVPEIPFLSTIMAMILLFISLFTIKDAPDMRLPIG